MPRPARPARRTSSGRTLTAAVVGLPLIGVPVVAPALAPAAAAVSSAVTTVDAREYGASLTNPIPAGGDTAAPDARIGASSARQSTTRANAKQSRGVVLIDEVLDYGEGEAAGTGMVLSRDGLVVTNHHVVADATSIRVKVPGTGRTYTATVLGYDVSDDVAVLQLQGARHLHPVTFHKRVRVGQPVTSVGNAEGRGRLIAAAGKVLKRRVTVTVRNDDGGRDRMPGLIKDSSDVVPGDSGGALRDAHNRVVAMNVAASVGTKDVVGFAIPIARVKRLAAMIIAGHATSQITIGLRPELGVVLDSRARGLSIAGTIPGSPAARAGLTKGDVLTSIGGTSVTNEAQLAAAMAHHQPGERVTLGWTDPHGGSHTATVTLGAAPVG